MRLICQSLFVAVIGLSVSAPGVRSASAAVKLPAIFSDHMVLQRDSVVPVWGWASAGEEVTVGIAGQTQTTKADADGKWSVRFDKLKATAPQTLTVRGTNSITIEDVLVGEVWLCSGQSNMAMTVNRALNFEQEQAAAKFPSLRMFTESSGAATSPQAECHGSWKVCSPESVGLFSATAYFFGRELHQKLEVPVGLVNSSVGGTAIEAWTSHDVQQAESRLQQVFDTWTQRDKNYDAAKAEAKYEQDLAAWKAASKAAKAAGKQPARAPQKPGQPRKDRNHPANLFNGKIAPLVPFAIRGAIWYQGEANARRGNAELYRVQLPLLIDDWRTRWGQGNFPFLWVQLPNFKKRTDDPNAESDWAVMRESMLKSLSVPNTGMAITIDVGEAGDIHPKNKQAVGQRLAMNALAQFYGQQIAASGPLYASHKIVNGAVTISFRHADGGLAPREGDLKGFAIAGADKKFVWAKAKIVGNTVVVSHPDVKEPVAVRYAWSDNPDCNLSNGEGLPASPFRTDD
ncbi:MAG: sialate O-acetylesterase [Planctomycetales bacterium]|nr:sialate O-acetylesterase [Planctomycetales bacterium]